MLDDAQLKVSKKLRAFLNKMGARKSSPIKSHILEDHYGVNGVVIRKMVQNARRIGIPIASSSDGYWVSKKKKEYMESIQHLIARADSLNETIMLIKENTHFK